VKIEKELRIFPNSIGKPNRFRSPLLTLYYILPPPPLLSHFNIGLFTKKIAQKPTKRFIKFSIVMILILKGFTESLRFAYRKQHGKKITHRN
jgi:hypothetical protein